jgi:hypothetical protein
VTGSASPTSHRNYLIQCIPADVFRRFGKTVCLCLHIRRLLI